MDILQSQASAPPVNENEIANKDISLASFSQESSAPMHGSLNLEPLTNISMLDTSSDSRLADMHNSNVSPVSAGLRLQTDAFPEYSVLTASGGNISASHITTEFQERLPKTKLPSRTPSMKHALGTSIGSTSNMGSAHSSAMSSPRLNSVADVTPLPSPLMSGDSPGPWNKFSSRPTSREYNLPGTLESAFVTVTGESISSAITNQPKRRAYHGLVANVDSSLTGNEMSKDKDATRHTRNRSLSEYTPETLQVPRQRLQTVSGPHAIPLDLVIESPSESHMRRERNLAIERGIAPPPVARPPTPPLSRTGAESSDSDSSVSNLITSSDDAEYFEAYSLDDNMLKKWWVLKVLGQGTFSKVYLATSLPPEDRINKDNYGKSMDGICLRKEQRIDPKKLVAVKICEHGPKGGASEDRVEMSVKRELEIMKLIHHPSVVHLEGFHIETTRAILVLSYCVGGDLFEVASEHHELLTPPLLRRVFTEVVGAVRYLHELQIVHRDIKLENILVNLRTHELARPTDWATYPYSVITLTDLGLSRHVTDDEKLTTRCGSDDYAAPEVIMGQPYDGRAVDAWSLGVLLYALLEFRMPFDPNPNMSESHKQRSKTSHRIARIEWSWIHYVGEDGDHDGNTARFEQMGLKGAMEVTEGLLKRTRSRWTLDMVSQHPWVRDAIQVDGGIKFRESKAEAVNTTTTTTTTTSTL